MKLFYLLAIVQGAYYMLTGMWALIDIDSFMAVTGPKCDIWLVKTVGALVIPIGLVLLLAAARKEMFTQTVVLAVSSAIAFTAIDIEYSLRDTISDIYLADAVVQVILAVGWVALVVAYRDKLNKQNRYV